MYFARTPWETLRAGERLNFTSLTGKRYDLTLLVHGRGHAGLYVRLPDRRLGRIAPQRVDWSTLQRTGVEPTTSRGDEVIVFARDKEHRGTLADSVGAGVSIAHGRAGFSSFPLGETNPKKFRLLYRTRTIYAGDEVVVRSRSGNEYRGLVVQVSPDRLTLELRPDRRPTSLIVSKLDLRTLRVLIPVMGTSPTWD
jgi:hypothetical protein